MPVGGRQRGERVCVGWEQGQARGGAGGAAPVARVDDTQNVLRWGGGPMGLGPWEQHRCVANGRRLDEGRGRGGGRGMSVWEVLPGPPRWLSTAQLMGDAHNKA